MSFPFWRAKNHYFQGLKLRCFRENSNGEIHRGMHPMRSRDPDAMKKFSVFRSPWATFGRRVETKMQRDLKKNKRKGR